MLSPDKGLGTISPSLSPSSFSASASWVSPCISWSLSWASLLLSNPASSSLSLSLSADESFSSFSSGLLSSASSFSPSLLGSLSPISACKADNNSFVYLAKTYWLLVFYETTKVQNYSVFCNSLASSLTIDINLFKSFLDKKS